MKKKIVFVGVLSVLVVLLASSFVAAGFGDWLKNVVTGKATTGSEDVNITIGNTAPRIIFVSRNSPLSPTEDGVAILEVNFTVEEPNGFGQIDTATSVVTANFSGTSFPDRTNTTCTALATYGVNFQNFTCRLEMQYFDNATDYQINVSISDTLGAAATNFTEFFTYSQLTAFVLSPDALTFPAVDVESTNTQSTNDPTVMNNTGNDPIADGSLSITAIDLLGETTSTDAIFAGNFTVDETDFCDAGPAMANASSVPITGATMPNNNHSVNDGSTGQEQLYYCLEALNNDLSAQSYSTANAGAWTVAIA